MGVMKEPYDTLLAVRLNEDLSPQYALGAP